MMRALVKNKARKKQREKAKEAEMERMRGTWVLDAIAKKALRHSE